MPISLEQILSGLPSLDTVHVVGFSGGIDSQATARWVLNRYPAESVLLTNTDAGGNESKETTDFIARYSANVHPVVTIPAIVADMGGRERAEIERRGLKPTDALTFDLLASLKGRFPSRCMQFCTEHLKLWPQRRWLSETVPEAVKVVRYAGVRREEGKNNKSWRATAAVEGWDDFFDCPMVRPIVDWTKQMCFDYVKYHGEEVNPLYLLGFDRVGCAPCINSGKKDILQWLHREPEQLDKIRNWEREVGFTFFAPCVPGMQSNFVDDVVEWAKTARGGCNFDLFAEAPRPACESKYGLCE